jgi:hypothetical protein
VVSLISPLSGIREHNSLINISDINERCYKIADRQVLTKLGIRIAEKGYDVMEHLGHSYWMMLRRGIRVACHMIDVVGDKLDERTRLFAAFHAISQSAICGVAIEKTLEFGRRQTDDERLHQPSFPEHNDLVIKAFESIDPTTGDVEPYRQFLRMDYLSARLSRLETTLAEILMKSVKK